MKTALSSWLAFLSSTRLFFLLLFWLMVVLVAGTVAQKFIGLYAAQKLFFAAPIFWVGGFIPLPGGATILTLIFIGLLIKLLREPWRMSRIGTLILHIGALLLLSGGFITALFSQEGNMVLPEGGEAAYFSDYYHVELAIAKEVDKDSERYDEVALFPETQLVADTVLSAPALPFTLKVEHFFRNAAVNARSAPLEGAVHGMRKMVELTESPPAKEAEANLSSLLFTVEGASKEADGAYGIFKNMPIAQHIEAKDRRYLIVLRPARTALPFSLKLTDFERITYPGTDTPKSYHSDVVLTDGPLTWNSRIEMNAPLRYKGYTFYQSSFSEENGAQTTVLAVVKNAGRLFPYISSIIMCIGLLIHLAQRLPVLIKRGKVAAMLLPLLLSGLHPLPARAEDAPPPVTLPMEQFAQIPLQDSGRIKPLDSFARDSLIRLSGHERLGEMSATAWLAELLFDQDSAYRREIFSLPNPEVLTALGLMPRMEHRYSFLELSDAVQANADTLRALLATPAVQRTLAQNQLAELQFNLLWYARLSHAVALIQPRFHLRDETLASALSLPVDKGFSYLDLMAHKPAFVARMSLVLKKKEKDFSKRDLELLALGEGMRQMAMDTTNPLLPIIPPQWDREGPTWLSAWTMLEEGRGSPRTASYLAHWQAMAEHFAAKDAAGWRTAALRAKDESFRLAAPFCTPRLLTLEYAYNRIQPFLISLVLYGIALACAGIYFFRPRTYLLRRTGGSFLLLGMVVHLAGVLARILIMMRPPVATLYESILFVALIAVLGAWLVERRRRDGIGLLAGSFIGVLLQFIGMRYAAEGETMGMLMAVLNTNFWLATHVVTITIGYGCALVAALLAHLYLLRRLMHPKARDALNDLLRTCQGVALVALFFATLGTILGGIWADQSWGRFWGWDPKENGAMLLVLWLAWLFHGKLAGFLRPLLFAALLGATAIIVALAWFGVNLLAVGLHSYGFTEHIAMRLALFCGIESSLLLLLPLIIRWREAAQNKERSA